MDLIQFAHRLRLAVWFNDKEHNVYSNTVATDCRHMNFRLKDFELSVKSEFSPPTVFHPIETYLNLVKNDLNILRFEDEHRPLVQPNLTRVEIDALKELTENRKITIKPADKGGGIVIMDITAYIQEAHRQLNDTEVYFKLSNDPKSEFEGELLRLVDQAYKNDVIDDKRKDFLIVQNPITLILYLLPKIHKTLINPPGRPIVSGRGSLFNNVSIFLDKVLCTFAINVPSFIRDTNYFLSKLKTVSVPPMLSWHHSM